MRRIGIAGIGNTSGTYLENLTEIFKRRVKLSATAVLLHQGGCRFFPFGGFGFDCRCTIVKFDFNFLCPLPV
jgi:hypothetical protein